MFNKIEEYFWTTVLLISTTVSFVLAPVILHLKKLPGEFIPEGIPDSSASFLTIGECAVTLAILAVVLLSQFINHPNIFMEQWRHSTLDGCIVTGIGTAFCTLIQHITISNHRITPQLLSFLPLFYLPMNLPVQYFINKKSQSRLETSGILLILFGLILTLRHLVLNEQLNNNNNVITQLLWVGSYIAAIVPYVIANSISELIISKPSLSYSQHTTNYRAIQNGVTDHAVQPKLEQMVEISSFTFVTCFFRLLTILSLIWLDFIPGFGTSEGLSEFKHRFLTDITCLFGIEDCGTSFRVVTWIFFIITSIGNYALYSTLSYSHKPLLTVILIGSSVSLLFWSIFEETDTGALLSMVPVFVGGVMYMKEDMFGCKSAVDHSEYDHLISDVNQY